MCPTCHINWQGVIYYAFNTGIASSIIELCPGRWFFCEKKSAKDKYNLCF